MSVSPRLRNRLEESRKTVEDALATIAGTLGKECAYSLQAGGKRIRPFLVFEACRALGGETSLALHAACAVEMIHTYSLIHDDLPGMDNDELRRGRPSLHMICGRERALFAGDRLLTAAFLELLRTALSEETVRQMAGRLAEASGPRFLAGGQFMDMYPAGGENPVWTRRMILGKTAAMIRVSMELGALAAGIDAEELASLSSIGDDTGWLFQLTDDILDVTGTTAEMGKAVSKDAEMGKWNPVAEMGLAGACKLAEETAADIGRRLLALHGDWSVIAELVDYLPERRK